MRQQISVYVHCFKVPLSRMLPPWRCTASQPPITYVYGCVCGCVCGCVLLLHMYIIQKCVACILTFTPTDKSRLPISAFEVFTCHRQTFYALDVPKRRHKHTNTHTNVILSIRSTIQLATCC